VILDIASDMHEV